MNHPQLIAVPILMIADYYLTVFGAKSSLVVYRNHFKIRSYELNPLWRKSVDSIRWFNPRHVALVTIVTVLLVILDRYSLPNGLFDLMLGILFGAFGKVCGSHLTNLLLFDYLNRNPNEIAGQVRLSMKLAQKISLYNGIGLLPFLTILVILAPGNYTFGMLLGIFSLMLASFVWGIFSKPSEDFEQIVDAELANTEQANRETRFNHF